MKLSERREERVFARDPDCFRYWARDYSFVFPGILFILRTSSDNAIIGKQEKERWRILYISSLRNYPIHGSVGDYLRILQDPKPQIVLQTLNASSVDVLARVWVKSSDYWSVLYEVNELVYDTFNKEGIGFPFPQLTVHQAKD